VGVAGKLRPRRLAEEAQLTPHGKGASWSCNQLTHSKIATIYTKTAFRKEQKKTMVKINKPSSEKDLVKNVCI
jgi:hypothetical protein